MSEFHPQGSSGRDAGRSHEPRDFNVRLALFFGIGLTAVVIGLACLVKLLFAGTAAERPEAAAPVGSPGDLRDRIPGPRLETAARDELWKVRRAEEGLLESYGWVDRDRRIVRIPIEAAMDKLLRQGFPVRPAASPGE